jgi:hypothetical protein
LEEKNMKILQKIALSWLIFSSFVNALATLKSYMITSYSGAADWLVVILLSLACAAGAWIMWRFAITGKF